MDAAGKLADRLMDGPKPQVTDRARPDGVLAVVDLGERPAERHLGIPAPGDPLSQGHD